MKLIRIPIFVLLLAAVGCAARTGDPIKDTGNIGIGLADGLHQLQIGTKELSPTPIPATEAKKIQSALLMVNSNLEKLPDFLEAADAARNVGQLEPGKVEETIAIVASISEQLNVVVAGLNVGEAAKRMLKLASETRVTSTKLQVALAQLQAELQKE